MANDFSTTPENPPKFVELAREGETDTYSDRLIQEHLEYPYLKPLFYKIPPAELLPRLIELAKKRWEVVSVNSSAYRFEAVATTTILRFKDDIVLELRPEPGGVTGIHIRSRSRVGKSDFGANARRIKEFISAISAEIGQEGEQRLMEQSQA